MLAAFQARTFTGTADLIRENLQSEQLVIVVTDSWGSTKARLYCFEKLNGKWKAQFSFPAVVGKNGMAPGDGQEEIKISETSRKKEGDMKSPAGLFLLGPAFGYAEKSGVKWIRMPYLQATDDLICIDDSNSRNYNQLTEKSRTRADWKTHEEMHLQSGEYKWGIFVQYNIKPVQAGRGSCIFLHVWDSETEGTAGCTAMEEKNIIKLLHWLQADKHPLLIQLPESEYRRISSRLQYPGL